MTFFFLAYSAKYFSFYKVLYKVLEMRRMRMRA